MKDKVCLCGMAKSSRYDAPVDDPDYDVWTLNEAEGLYVKDKKLRNADGKKGFLEDASGAFRCDLLLQMHPEFEYTNPENFNDSGHWEYLQQEHPFPIMMLGIDERIPASNKYPLDDILADFGEISQYFTSTCAYMIALAIHWGYKTIRIAGFEMASEEEYHNQRNCAEFWLGIARGRGLKIELPSESNLLGGKSLLYGYEMGTSIHEMHMEITINSYKKSEKKAESELRDVRGQMTTCHKQMMKEQSNKTRRKHWEKRLRALQTQQEEAWSRLNFCRGAKIALENLLLETAGRKISAKMAVAPVIMRAVERIKEEHKQLEEKKK